MGALTEDGQAVIARVAECLRQAFVAPREVRAAVPLTAGGAVWRCALAGPGPASVVAKLRRTDAADVRSAHDGLGTERAALRFLEELGLDGVPRVVAADAGVLVLEDLGPGPSLTELLLGDDAAAATAGVVAAARAMGLLHAGTGGGGAARWDPEQAGAEGIGRQCLVICFVDVRDCWADIASQVTALGAATTGAEARTAADVGRVVEALASPGPWLAFSAGDPCPGNVLVGPGGAALIDFEMAAFRHALLDAAALRVPFPHCTPWARLPTEVIAQAERAYREAVSSSIPAAADAEAYARALVPALAAWMLVRLRRLRRIDQEDVDVLRRRTQIVHTLDVFLAAAGASGLLPDLAASIRRLRSWMTRRWPEATLEAPLYAAYRAPGRPGG